MAGSTVTAEDFCRSVLSHGDLPSKLRPPRDSDGKLLQLAVCGSQPDSLSVPLPARVTELRFHSGGERLPSMGELTQPAARVACLQRFAHHELQAIELFAWAVLRFPSLPAALRRGFLLVLEEEQQHLQLYLDRIQAHGAQFGAGDGQLSDYLWQHRERIESAAQPELAFLCAVGLTFEQANLDFAPMYRDAFRMAGDEETARVLQQVHDDEIRHVRLAVRWLRRLKRPDESDLAAYLRAVPFPLSAARAKGRRFEVAARRQAGLDDQFIDHVRQAEPYRKKPPPERPSSGRQLWLLPNLGAEEGQPVPTSARGFLRGLYGAWAAIFDGSQGAPWLLPPGDGEAQAAWRQALGAERAGAALACLDELGGGQARSMLAWLNAPSAAALAEQHRLELLGTPPATTLALHDKAFAMQTAAALDLEPACLRGLTAIFSPAQCEAEARGAGQLLAIVAAWPAWTGRRFVLKPRLGTSGRGRSFGQLSDEDGQLRPVVAGSAWAALAQRGGCIVEPWLRRQSDLSVQLMLRAGEAQVLGTTSQLVTRSGQIRGNRGILDAGGALRSGADAAVEAALIAHAVELGRAAAERGLRGIAGIDAFTFQGPAGETLLRPVVELNARFTTGTVALGLARRLEALGRLPRGGGWALVLKSPGRQQLDAAAGVSYLCPLARGPALLFAEDPAALDVICANGESGEDGKAEESR